jgi:3-dehydroquinate dehydratase-2
MSRRVLVINGPNLNMLGTRQPEIYGTQTLGDIEADMRKLAGELADDIELVFVQSNHEGDLIDAIQQQGKDAIGIIINAGAYTHTSIAIRDALVATGTPAIEIHLSNIHARDEFRHHSYIAPIAIGQIAGFGPAGYNMALRYLALRLSDKKGKS